MSGPAVDQAALPQHHLLQACAVGAVVVVSWWCWPSGISMSQGWRKLKLREVWYPAQDLQAGLTGAELKFIWL